MATFSLTIHRLINQSCGVICWQMALLLGNIADWPKFIQQILFGLKSWRTISNLGCHCCHPRRFRYVFAAIGMTYLLLYYYFYYYYLLFNQNWAISESKFLVILGVILGSFTKHWRWWQSNSKNRYLIKRTVEHK